MTTHRPNSSGLVALEILNILEQFEPPAPSVFGGGRGADTRWVHLGLEASKLAMADRDAHLTDPDFLEIPSTGCSTRLRRVARPPDRRAAGDPRRRGAEPEGRWDDLAGRDRRQTAWPSA